MPRGVARLLLLLALAASVAPSAPAHAGQPDPRAEARELGERAINALNKGQYEQALRLLSQAERLFHAPTHLLFIARANRELGRLVAAHDAYQRVVHEPVPDYAPEAFHRAKRSARQELAELLKRLPTVRLAVRGAPSDEVKVTIDGAEVSADRLARTIALEPGGHRIEAVAAGAEPVVRRLELKAGDVTQQIELDLSAGAAPPSDGGDDRTHSGADQAHGPSPWLVSGIVALGVGAVGLTVGAITGGLTLSKASEIQDTCVDGHCPPDQEDAASTTTTLGNVSTVSFIVGSVAAAAGIVLLVAAPDDDAGASDAARSRALRLRIAPARLELVGRF